MRRRAVQRPIGPRTAAFQAPRVGLRGAADSHGGRFRPRGGLSEAPVWLGEMLRIAVGAVLGPTAGFPMGVYAFSGPFPDLHPSAKAHPAAHPNHLVNPFLGFPVPLSGSLDGFLDRPMSPSAVPSCSSTASSPIHLDLPTVRPAVPWLYLDPPVAFRISKYPSYGPSRAPFGLFFYPSDPPLLFIRMLKYGPFLTPRTLRTYYRTLR